MPKILSQSGTSLADTYDVVGSIAGVENLESKDVHLFDEMGARVHSERLLSFTVVLNTAAISQSSNFEAAAAGFPDSINRLLGVFVSVPAANAGRVEDGTVSIVQPSGQEFPIWSWDLADDVERGVRFDLAGAGEADRIALISTTPFVPLLITRGEDAGRMQSLALRGSTGAFGAGTIVISVSVLLLRPDGGNPPPGAPSSHGLPPPSW